MAASEVQPESPQEGFSCQRTVLRQLSTFIRKPPSLQGLSQLSQLAADCDLSYCPLLLTAAIPYLSQTLAQWLRISQQGRNAAILFLQLLALRLQKTRFDWLQSKLAPLRLKFQRAMGRPLGRLPSDHFSLCMAEDLLAKYQSHKQIVVEKQVQLQGETNSSSARLQPQLRLTDKPQLSRLQTLRQLYFKASISKKLPSSDNEDQSDSSEEKAQNYISNCRDCATCLSWVREDEDLSFPLPKQPITFFGPLSLMPDFREPLLEQIVAFLNGKGGVVLLGCRQNSGGRVEAVVESINQNLKENIENRLQKWLQAIHPPVTLKRQVDLNWIPIGSPQQFVKGGFLLRLAVEPIDPSITSFYSLTNHHFAQQTALGPIRLEGEAVYRLMQQRFNSAQTSRTLNGLRERGNWIPGLSLHLGICQLPEKGDPEYAGQPIGPGLGIVEKREGNPLLQNHQNFKNVSLLIVSEKGRQPVEKILQKEQKFDVLIERAFPERKFWLASTTWLLWHSVKFQKMMTAVKKNMRELSKTNNSKPPLLISTCPYLKVINGPLEQEKVVELITVGKKEAGEEVVHSLIDEYDYFQCQAPITAVFLYFYLNDKYRLKSVFQKPNPTKHKHTRPSHKDSTPRFAQNSTRREDRFKIEKAEQQLSEDIHPEQGSPNKKPVNNSIRRKENSSFRKDLRSENSVESKQQQKGVPIRAEEPAKEVEQVLLCWYMDQSGCKYYYYSDWQVVTYDAYNRMLGTRNYDQTQYNQAYYYYTSSQDAYTYHQ